MKSLITYDIIQPCVENFTTSPSTLRMLTSLYTKKKSILTDRFDILNKDCEFNLQTKGDSLDNIIGMKSISFKECCEQRTEEIIRLANKLDKDIYVSWSGGVDSTLVACMLLMSDIDNKKIHIIHTQESINEYPFFYTLLQKQNVCCHKIYQDMNAVMSLVGDNIFVNGLCGDQLDNFNIALRYKTSEHFNNWKDEVYNILSPSYKPYFDKLISDVENYAKLFPITLNVFGEFTWLFNYCIKWIYEAEFFKCFNNNPNNSMAFFNTDYFSHYGLMSFTQKNIKKRNSSYEYKTDWKKLIYKYTKDEDYFLYKGKDMTFEKNDNGWKGLCVVDNNGYHYYNDIDSNVAKKIMLEYIKPEYKEYYNVLVRDKRINDA